MNEISDDGCRIACGKHPIRDLLIDLYNGAVFQCYFFTDMADMLRGV